MTNILTTADPILADHVSAIRVLGKRVVGDIIEIGRRLIEAKRIVGHGNWLTWLEREFGWSDDTAERFMAINRLQGKIPQLAEYELPVSGLYLLARPTTPLEARDEVIERAEAGEKLTHAQIKQTIDTAKQARKPRKDDPAVPETARKEVPTVVTERDAIIAEYTAYLIGMISEAAGRLAHGDCVTLLDRMLSIINGLKITAKYVRERPPGVVEQAPPKAPQPDDDGIPEFLRRPVP
jgi:hypothetical protein